MKNYILGFVGLNNVKANDYVNVIIQALIHIPPIRNYFILNTNETSSSSQLGNNTSMSILVSKEDLAVNTNFTSRAIWCACQKDVESTGIQRPSQSTRIASGMCLHREGYAYDNILRSLAGNIECE